MAIWLLDINIQQWRQILMPSWQSDVIRDEVSLSLRFRWIDGDDAGTMISTYW